MEITEYDDESNPFVLHDSCPNCGTEYDEIDYEYQICSRCHFECIVEYLNEKDNS